VLALVMLQVNGLAHKCCSLFFLCLISFTIVKADALVLFLHRVFRYHRKVNAGIEVLYLWTLHSRLIDGGRRKKFRMFPQFSGSDEIYSHNSMQGT